MGHVIGTRMRAAGWAVLALAGAGAGMTVSPKPLWATGGSGPSPQRVTLVQGVVPSRAQQLSRLHDSSPDKPFDVLIIGGGATGAGCALDAATRCVRAGHVNLVKASQCWVVITAFP